ncbi:hypothetical protein ACF07Q_28675 [Nocardiopsis dassonvillei]|uniref:hypothetical protein n=1 Tax=Nocardiopsis dassonvillei TaxID=2014 RepID=UPI003701EB4D
MTELPRRFRLIRDRDVTGASGTGHVADGVHWPDGTATVRWRSDRASTVHWDSIDDAEAIHGHGGATRVEWIDPDPDEFDATCPRCPDGHRHPSTVSWGTYERPNPDGARRQIVLMRSDGSHVNAGDARWAWQVLNGRAD